MLSVDCCCNICKTMIVVRLSCNIDLDNGISCLWLKDLFAKTMGTTLVNITVTTVEVSIASTSINDLHSDFVWRAQRVPSSHTSKILGRSFTTTSCHEDILHNYISIDGCSRLYNHTLLEVIYSTIWEILITIIFTYHRSTRMSLRVVLIPSNLA